MTYITYNIDTTEGGRRTVVVHGRVPADVAREAILRSFQRTTETLSPRAIARVGIVPADKGVLSPEEATFALEFLKEQSKRNKVALSSAQIQTFRIAQARMAHSREWNQKLIELGGEPDMLSLIRERDQLEAEAYKLTEIKEQP